MANKSEKTNAPGQEQTKEKAINGFRVRFVVPKSIMPKVLSLAFESNVACMYKVLEREKPTTQVKLSGACTEVYQTCTKIQSMISDIAEIQEFLNSYKCTGIHIETMPNIPFVELSKPL